MSADRANSPTLTWVVVLALTIWGEAAFAQEAADSAVVAESEPSFADGYSWPVGRVLPLTFTSWSDPNVSFSEMESFFLVPESDDQGGIANLVADAFIRDGRALVTGSDKDMPHDVEIKVTYESYGMYGALGGGLSALLIYLRDPKTNEVLGVAQWANQSKHLVSAYLIDLYRQRGSEVVPTKIAFDKDLIAYGLRFVLSDTSPPSIAEWPEILSRRYMTTKKMTKQFHPKVRAAKVQSPTAAPWNNVEVRNGQELYPQRLATYRPKQFIDRREVVEKVIQLLRAGAPGSAETDKVITIWITDIAFIGLTECFINFTLETGDGQRTGIQAKGKKFMDTRALELAMADMVGKTLNNPQVIAYIGGGDSTVGWAEK